MFAASLSTQNLIDLCRVLRVGLGAGLTLKHVFRQQSSGHASGAVRSLAERVLESIEKGDSLSSALDREERLLSPLFRAMVQVGEQTGNLPEIFHTLEDHYRLEQKLRRQIIRQSLGTVIQFFAAIFVVTVTIFILGMIGQSNPGSPAIKIFGLSGTSGALIFLSVTLGSVAALWLAATLFLKYPRHAGPVQAFLMKVPALGPALYSLVMGRFTMALRLTLDSGLSIVKGLKLSLRATGNAWFASKSETITSALKSGETLTHALAGAKLFEDEFLHIVAAAEEGGSVPEAMGHQAEYWHEEASRRLGTLAQMMTLLLWLIYAGLAIYAIFQIASVYLGMLNV